MSVRASEWNFSEMKGCLKDTRVVRKWRTLKVVLQKGEERETLCQGNAYKTKNQKSPRAELQSLPPSLALGHHLQVRNFFPGKILKLPAQLPLGRKEVIAVVVFRSPSTSTVNTNSVET